MAMWKKKEVSKNINQTKSNKKQQEKQNKNNLKYQLLQNRMYSNLLIDLNLYRRIYYWSFLLIISNDELRMSYSNLVPHVYSNPNILGDTITQKKKWKNLAISQSNIHIEQQQHQARVVYKNTVKCDKRKWLLVSLYIEFHNPTRNIYIYILKKWNYFDKKR
jgi:hypothetical protein